VISFSGKFEVEICPYFPYAKNIFYSQIRFFKKLGICIKVWPFESYLHKGLALSGFSAFLVLLNLFEHISFNNYATSPIPNSYSHLRKKQHLTFL